MRILTLDIETSPHKSYHWRMWQENIAPAQNIQPTTILTFACKWLSDREVTYRTWNDTDMYDVLHDRLSNADIVITYNGDKFDILHINREFAERGLGPVRPFASIDLLKTVKKRFKFPSNRLDYVAHTLLGVRKLDTGGFDLWPAFINGDERALRLMRRYNIRDVRITEKLYRYLRPWVVNHPHIGPSIDIRDDNENYRCPACNSPRQERHRPRRTRCYAIRVLQCKSCGHWHDGRRRKI